jgi:hypothetical protein
MAIASLQKPYPVKQESFKSRDISFQREFYFIVSSLKPKAIIIRESEIVHK